MLDGAPMLSGTSGATTAPAGLERSADAPGGRVLDSESGPPRSVGGAGSARVGRGMEDWELAVRLGVQDTIGRYVRFADGGRSEALAALFAVDGVLATDTDELRGRVAIAEYLEGVRGDLATSAVGGGRIRHHVSSLRLVVDHREEANATSYFLAMTGSGLDHWGVYRDRLVRVEDQWLFAHRRVTVEGAVPGSWAAQRHGT